MSSGWAGHQLEAKGNGKAGHQLEADEKWLGRVST